MLRHFDAISDAPGTRYGRYVRLMDQPKALLDDGGAELFIEVKSCAGKEISSVTLTVNEWQAACDPSLRDRYNIYLVTNALSANPSIEIMRNLASIVAESKLSCKPIVYELNLRSTLPAN